jgi:hypothetical protein
MDDRQKPMTPLDFLKQAYQAEGAMKIKPNQYIPALDVQKAIEAIKNGSLEPKTLHPLWFLRMGFNSNEEQQKKP